MKALLVHQEVQDALLGEEALSNNDKNKIVNYLLSIFLCLFCIFLFIIVVLYLF